MRAVAEHVEAWDRFPGDALALNVYADVGRLATDRSEVTPLSSIVIYISIYG